MRAQVREPGCVFDRQNDNLLVHMMCPLFNVGATDPGSGLRTQGYRLRVESRMQQYRIRRYYYQSQTTPTPVGTGGAGAVPAREYCYCFEKFWSIRFVELDTDLRWHPKLCAYQNVNTQGYCYPYFPGSNPPILDNETDSRVSLGSGEIFDYSVRLGEHGLTVPSSVLTAIRTLLPQSRKNKTTAIQTQTEHAAHALPVRQPHSTLLTYPRSCGPLPPACRVPRPRCPPALYSR
jgi:hypothetical protein